MRRILFTIIIGSFFIVAPISAAEVYVSEIGSDATGDGSSANPYATITQALTVISSGDTVYCQGTIIDNVIIPAAASGTVDAYTTITAGPGYTAIIDGGGAGHNSVINLSMGVSYFKIDSLNITNADFFGIVNILTASTNHIQITNNNIYGLTNGPNAVYVSLSQASDSVISGNHIYGDGDDLIGILISESPNSEISANRIHDFESNGIIIYNNSYDSILKNNWIYGIGGSSSSSRGAVYAYDTYNLQIYNNVFFNIQDETNIVSAIQVVEGSLDSHDVLVRNNIFSSVDLGFVGDANSISGSSSDYNIFYSVTYFGIVAGVEYLTFEQWQTYAYQDANGYETNPLFESTDPTAYDFHVQAASPAIDHGEDLAEVLIDFDGEARPYNITDIGSDEMAVVAAPESLAATPDTDSADFSWSLPGAYTATSYNVQVSADEYFTTPAEFTVIANTMDLDGMSSAETYYFKVQAVYATEYQAYTSDWSEITEFITVPDAPTNFTATARTADSITVSWTAPSGNITLYSVTYYDIDNTENVINPTTTDTSIKISDLDANAEYHFAVFASNGVELSDVADFLVVRTLPAKVKGVKVPKKFKRSHQVKVKWASAGTGLTYQVKLMNKKSKKIKIYNTLKLKKIIKKLKANTVYKIRVRAKYDVDNIGAWSKIKKFKTQQ